MVRNRNDHGPLGGGGAVHLLPLADFQTLISGWCVNGQSINIYISGNQAHVLVSITLDNGDHRLYMDPGDLRQIIEMCLTAVGATQYTRQLTDLTRKAGQPSGSVIIQRWQGRPATVATTPRAYS